MYRGFEFIGYGVFQGLIIFSFICVYLRLSVEGFFFISRKVAKTQRKNAKDLFVLVIILVDLERGKNYYVKDSRNAQ